MGTCTYLRSNSLLLILILPFLPSPPTIGISDCQDASRDLSPLSTDALPSWNSSSGVFTLGFQYAPFNDQGSVLQPLLAIRFTKSSDQTVVWYAKPDSPVPVGSTANLTSDGIFIYDTKGNIMWQRPTPNQDNLIVSCASLQDDGNFVLQHKNGSLVWQSFWEPTDTLLPGQNFSKSRPVTLQARQSDTSFSSGNFNLSWQGGGNLVLSYLSKSGSQQHAAVYWSSGTNDRGSWMVFDEFGSIHIASETAVIYNVTSDTPGSKESYYMARIGSDGVFRRYYLPRNAGAVGDSCASKWSIFGSIPDDICLTVIDEKENFLCGLNSFCISINEKPECRCPDHYSPFLLDNLTNCRPDFPPPSCLVDGWEMDQGLVDFKEYSYLNWPFSDYDFEVGPFDKDICKEKCREDCFCAAVVYNNQDDVGHCWKKKYPLSNGRYSTKAENGTVLFLKFRNLHSNSQKRSYLMLVLSFLLGGSVFLNVLGKGVPHYTTRHEAYFCC